MMLALLRGREKGIAAAVAAELEKDLNGAEFTPTAPAPDLLNRTAVAVDAILLDARSEKAKLEAEIAERQERLRQTNVVIAAFEPVVPALADGYDAADDARKSYDLAIETKRRRGDRHFTKQVEAA